LTLTEDLAPQAEDLLARLSEIGLRAISISGSQTSDELKDAITHTRELAANLGMDLIWDIPAPYSQNNPIAIELPTVSSRAGRAWLYVEPDGDVQGVNVILGNIAREAWSDIWEKAKEFQKE
jgi:MoaA/NifB/PqqE/SkfB family radical SAM enzyme